MIRIVENNDWVILSLVGVGLVYIIMFKTLQRNISLSEFVVQNYSEAANIFLSWLIVSVAYCVTFAVLFSQYIPIVPRFVTEYLALGGYTFNKMGFMLMVLFLYYGVRFLLTYLFFASIGDFKKMQDFGFAAQKFYFVLSLILIILSFVHYYFSINKLSLFNYYLIAMVFLAIFKMLYYMFHRQQPLPKDLYYKILYICTFQILPMLALWKFLFI